MLRRLFIATCAALLLSGIGCQSSIGKHGILSEVKDHAVRLDFEASQLHTDVKDNIFGVENPPDPPMWHTYRS